MKSQRDPNLKTKRKGDMAKLVDATDLIGLSLGLEKKDRCRDSMESILTNGAKCVGRGLFTSKLQKEKE
ncbi:hypothetical protein H5410_036215 [Solanum commersonii]|uniref:Uncharacterized protein n=1 Tax=Solanum commersonii TaxID=4109 RepID=A0A9J5Y508_SOLCO|nr:hypothetical protein H5410_036215 [Solanum commersonii]